MSGQITNKKHWFYLFIVWDCCG